MSDNIPSYSTSSTRNNSNTNKLNHPEIMTQTHGTHIHDMYECAQTLSKF